MLEICIFTNKSYFGVGCKTLATRVFLHKQLPRGGNFGKISVTKLTICVIIAEVLLLTCDNLYKQYYYY
jgi:hypothetical protein